MGSNTSTEKKTVDSTGTVNNNVVVNGEVDVTSLEIVILLGIICAIKIMEFIYFIYKRNYHNIKKRASTQSVQSVWIRQWHQSISDGVKIRCNHIVCIAFCMHKTHSHINVNSHTHMYSHCIALLQIMFSLNSLIVSSEPYSRTYSFLHMVAERGCYEHSTVHTEQYPITHIPQTLFSWTVKVKRILWDIIKDGKGIQRRPFKWKW